MVTVACVLKSGGVYTPDHVRILEAMVSRNLDGIERFVCLTDVEFHLPHVERLPLYHKWPGSWSKLELFRPIFKEGTRILYFDLDSVICGNLHRIATATEPFVAVGDPYRTERKTPIASNLLLWTAGELIDVYRTVARNPSTFMAMIQRRYAYHFVAATLERLAMKAALWENVAPSQVESFSRLTDMYPVDMRVLVFVRSRSQESKPWTVDSDWMRHHYTAEVPA